MNKEFIPYELALALKELGFDETCIMAYYHLLSEDKKDKLFLRYNNNQSNSDNAISAPTFSQAFRWFREKGYDVKVQKESDGLYFGFYWTGAAWIIVGNGSYEEAELECLKKLIEITKEKK